MNSGTCYLADEAATLAFGAHLAQLLEGRGLVTLQGNLGGGKTTLCRGLIQALGHQGKVKSPTYTLVEPYDLPQARVLHYDLYRLADASELEFLGMRDFLDEHTLTLVEWPERAGKQLPLPDLALELEVRGQSRVVHWQCQGPRATELASGLQASAVAG
ncbi:MAG TPA: tRNA (adenosine(37)-N6)-threonylcarbamoyltransferase complex ATPase subunit type 1 TsaE [Pseudomonadaceae bacterium]|nr:tRNA (adenosine(37)-N6)-threonylcarbamoyltransferase complex ATPase subunit type 1 TsaE [Pseudomonadaceae bacterium]